MIFDYIHNFENSASYNVFSSKFAIFSVFAYFNKYMSANINPKILSHKFCRHELATQQCAWNLYESKEVPTIKFVYEYKKNNTKIYQSSTLGDKMLSRVRKEDWVLSAMSLTVDISQPTWAMDSQTLDKNELNRDNLKLHWFQSAALNINEFEEIYTKAAQCTPCRKQ